MRELLLKHEYLEDADHVSRLIDLANIDLPEFEFQMHYGGVWSGSGSIMDVQFSGKPSRRLARDVRSVHGGLDLVLHLATAISLGENLGALCAYDVRLGRAAVSKTVEVLGPA